MSKENFGKSTIDKDIVTLKIESLKQQKNDKDSLPESEKA